MTSRIQRNVNECVIVKLQVVNPNECPYMQHLLLQEVSLERLDPPILPTGTSLPESGAKTVTANNLRAMGIEVETGMLLSRWIPNGINLRVGRKIYSMTL